MKTWSDFLVEQGVTNCPYCKKPMAANTSTCVFCDNGTSAKKVGRKVFQPDTTIWSKHPKAKGDRDPKYVQGH